MQQHMWSRIQSDCSTSTVLLVDVSCKTKGSTLDNIKGAVTRFIFMNQQANERSGLPPDNMALVSFANTPHLLSNFTTNYSVLINKVEKVQRQKGKPAHLGDALVKGVDLCQSGPAGVSMPVVQRIIVFTSGENLCGSGVYDPIEIAKTCATESIQVCIVECNKRHCNLEQRHLLLDIARQSGSNFICEDDNIHLLFDNNFMHNTAITPPVADFYEEDLDSDFSDSEEAQLNELRAKLAFIIPNTAKIPQRKSIECDSIESSSISYNLHT
eukprot:TRINITY_DN17732_c0_g1_i1.p1 TRINITY_DN17732_c0_g1~~TRINITY_DN17732_c0_g1_i1.p1  ORF type:complete len:270 (+),score=32.06 TRINITY_DN17732_c0_g1_i1:250-1059(+)